MKDPNRSPLRARHRATPRARHRATHVPPPRVIFPNLGKRPLRDHPRALARDSVDIRRAAVVGVRRPGAAQSGRQPTEA